ncbi:MAG: alpha/beta hydrolase [Pedobacter sp.]|nr:MAG: alpha/beta hydrolase [Pedobacter sp.]
MKLNLLLVILLFGALITRAQESSRLYLGYRILHFKFKGIATDVLVKSKRGEENLGKPVLLFSQGSLPIPLIIQDGLGSIGPFPFDQDLLLDYFHVAIISKPGVPILASAGTLGPDMGYLDHGSQAPEVYRSNNRLDFYVERNLACIRMIYRQSWSKGKLVLAGHSEGAAVALACAGKSTCVRALLYCAGNPAGRMSSIIQQFRVRGERDFSLQFDYYRKLVKSRAAQLSQSETNDLSFSGGQFSIFKSLDIPVLVCFGSEDPAAPLIDYLQLEMIAARKKNVEFKNYPGLEHNFFELHKDRSIDYANCRWDMLAADWLVWLKRLDGHHEILSTDG